MFKKITGCIVAGVSALLSGCGEQVPNVISNYNRGEIVMSSFIYATSKGPMMVELYGNPFKESGSEVADMIIKRMAQAMPQRPVKFTTIEAQAPSPEHRVKILLGGENTVNGERLCQGNIKLSAAPDPNKIKIRAVYCASGQLMSDVEGWMLDPKTATDERFGQMISQVTIQLFK